MAATGSWTVEIETSVAAPRLFRAAVMDWHNLAPKAAPQVIAGVKAIQGFGAVGCIRQFNYTSAMPFSFAKERLDFLDVENCECKLTLIEGAHIGTVVESVTSHIKVETAANGGSVVKMAATYKLLPGVEEKGEIAKAKESVTTLIKTVEAYLVANPDAYKATTN